MIVTQYLKAKMDKKKDSDIVNLITVFSDHQKHCIKSLSRRSEILYTYNLFLEPKDPDSVAFKHHLAL